MLEKGEANSPKKSAELQQSQIKAPYSYLSFHITENSLSLLSQNDNSVSPRRGKHARKRKL